MNQRVDKDTLPLDKPRRTPSHPTKSHIVKTRVDGKEKIIRFGEQGAETAGKPKAGESERMKNKRASFKSRHSKNIAKGKSSPAYWANKVKWADGGSVNLEEMYQKYERGGKARGSLLEGFMAELERLRSLQRKQDSLEFRPEYTERGQPLALRYDRAPTRSDPTRSDADPQTAGVPTERSPTGMNPNFASALENLIAAASEAGHDVTINSGYRSPERQAELFADAVRKYGSEAAARRWVAPPGKSRHNHGIAADLGYGSDEARDWVHANAEKYGLNFRMDWEPWHIEPLNMQRGGAVKGYETGGFKDIARSVLGQGLGLGWGDEGEAWLRSKLGDERYEDALAEIQASNRAYAENNPIGSIVGEVAGGLIPTTAAYLATPFTGGAAAPAAAATTARMGMLAPRVAAQLPNWMRGAAVGAGEGAIVGAGMADQGESRAEGAAMGAAIGAPLGAAAPVAIDAVQGALDRRAIRTAASQVPDDSAYEPLRQRLFDQGVMNYAVLPQGNVNLQPAISAETLRGPDVQTVESFLAQIKGTPGVSQDALEELSRRYEDLPPNSTISKADFEARIPPSQYNTVDLKNLAGNSEYDMDLYREQAIDWLYEHPDEPYQNVLYSIGLDPNEDNLHLIAGLNEGAIDLEDVPEEFLNAFRRASWEDDIFGNLSKTTDSARNELVEAMAQDFAEQTGTSDAGYRYLDSQRLLTENTQDALDDNYFEIGVTHPDMAGKNYWHYPNALNPDDGMIGHIRGTYIPADKTNATVRAPLADNVHFPDASIPVRPNSVVIEEIQSDAQKDAAQSGALRQTHGTLFKAAINDALKRGADTVYLPSAATIALPRGGNRGRFAPIYDQQIVKEGLRPLSQIPGVEIKPVGVNGALAYHEITFSPEAVETILRGRGQRTPGYAKGGAVMAYDPTIVEARIASIGKGYAKGGAVRAYDPATIDQLVKTVREGAHV